MKHLVLLSALVLLQNFFAKATNRHETKPYSTTDVRSKMVIHAAEHYNRFDDKLSILTGINTLTLKPTASGIVLNWTVEETVNLQYFLIEHAVDGQNFSPLFEVPVQVAQHMYSFVDTATKVYDKGVYYRVKAVYPTKVLVSAVSKLPL